MDLVRNPITAKAPTEKRKKYKIVWGDGRPDSYVNQEALARGKAMLAEEEARDAEKAKEAEKAKQTGVSEFVIDSLVHDYLLDALLGDEYDEADKRLAEYKIENDYSEVLEDVGGGYGDYDELVAYVVGKLKQYKPRQIAMGMKEYSENGATMFDDYIEKHLVREEVKASMKDEAKVKRFQETMNTAIADGQAKERAIVEMMKSVVAPKGKKAEIIAMIEAMVTDPVDRLKLRLNKRDKSTLQTIYMNTKARHDWYKKNRPGQAIDYDID